MSTSRTISRRTVLRGLGAAVALPWLEGMAPSRALAAARLEERAGPLRMAFLYVPNGAHMPDWTPAAEGALTELPAILRPLAGVKDDILVLTGLAQHNGFALGDGAGDHARALGSFLTGAHPRKTDGADIRVGISVDQLAAQRIGTETRFPSVELGIDPSAQSGNCDSGYSCAYSSNISWRTESTPVPKEVNPRSAFERLFGGGSPGEAEARRARYRHSILDFVADDARRLRARLGGGDGRKVDEYLHAIREIELRIAALESGEGVEVPDYEMPEEKPKDYREHIRLMLDMIVLAFQTDSTRVATFMYANEGSNRSYKPIDVPEGHHDLSHHGGDEEKHAKIKKINTFHIEQFAYLLEKLKGIPEGDGNLLDRSMIVYGSGIGDGNRHNHNDLPILFAGHGNGTFATGRHVKYEKDTPLNNLYLAMLDRMAIHTDQFGDSTGRLSGLEG